MARPKVSFIIPVYGVEKYLQECLDSILYQTLQDWECILIDDGSPDKSGEICDSYAKNDKRFRVIHKKNAGVSSARNDGIDIAKGEWAYFVDSDDWLELDAAEKLLDAAESNDVDCVMSYCEEVYPDGKRARSALFSKQFIARRRCDIEDIQKYIMYQTYSPYYTEETVRGFAAPWGKFVKLSILKVNEVRFDPYLKGIFDDGLYSLYLLDYCSSVMYFDYKSYNYRIVASSLTHAFKSDAMEIQKRGYKRIEEFLKKTGKDESFWRAYYAHVVRFLGGYLSDYYFHPANSKSRKELIAELRKDLSTEPFISAARFADPARLVAKDRYLAFCERRRLIIGLRLYVIIRKIVKGKRR